MNICPVRVSMSKVRVSMGPERESMGSVKVNPGTVKVNPGAVKVSIWLVTVGMGSLGGSMRSVKVKTKMGRLVLGLVHIGSLKVNMAQRD